MCMWPHSVVPQQRFVVQCVCRVTSTSRVGQVGVELSRGWEGARAGSRGVVRAVLSSPRQSYEATVYFFGLFSHRYYVRWG